MHIFALHINLLPGPPLQFSVQKQKYFTHRPSYKVKLKFQELKSQNRICPDIFVIGSFSSDWELHRRKMTKSLTYRDLWFQTKIMRELTFMRRIYESFGAKEIEKNMQCKINWLPAVRVAKNHGVGGQEHPYKNLPQDFEFFPPVLTPSCQYHPENIPRSLQKYEEIIEKVLHLTQSTFMSKVMQNTSKC